MSDGRKHRRALGELLPANQPIGWAVLLFVSVLVPVHDVPFAKLASALDYPGQHGNDPYKKLLPLARGFAVEGFALGWNFQDCAIFPICSTAM